MCSSDLGPQVTNGHMPTGNTPYSPTGILPNTTNPQTYQVRELIPSFSQDWDVSMPAEGYVVASAELKLDRELTYLKFSITLVSLAKDIKPHAETDHQVINAIIT